MLIDTTTETPTLILDRDHVYRSPFGPAQTAWTLVYHSATIAECRATDVGLLEELECVADGLIRNHALKSYDCRLASKPPAPDGGPTYVYTVAGNSIRVTTDLAGNALEAVPFRHDQYNETTYWKLSGLTFEEAMNDEVEAAIRFNEANRRIITERIHSMDPDDHRPLLRWPGGWHDNARDAELDLRSATSADARVQIFFVDGVLDLSTSAWSPTER